MKTEKLLLKYLENSGVRVDLGATEELPRITASENYQALVNDLKANSAFKNKMIIVIYVLLSVFFLFCLYLFFLVKKDPDKIGYLFGGTVFSILAVIAPMIKLWKDKERTDTFLKVLPYLKEEDRITAVMGFFKAGEVEK